MLGAIDQLVLRDDSIVDVERAIGSGVELPECVNNSLAEACDTSRAERNIATVEDYLRSASRHLQCKAHYSRCAVRLPTFTMKGTTLRPQSRKGPVMMML